MNTLTSLTISNYILSAFVILHISMEFYHYISEFIKNKRDKKMLKHLDDHLDNMECTCDKKNKGE